MVREREVKIDFRKGKPQTITLIVPAGEASALPPLGGVLGQHEINAADFCKRFNEQTKDFEPGIPLHVHIHKRFDNTFDLDIIPLPDLRWFFRHVQKDSGMTVRRNVYLDDFYDIFIYILYHNPYDNIPPSKLLMLMFGTIKSMRLRIIKGHSRWKDYNG